MKRSELTPIAHNLSKIYVCRLAEHIHIDHYGSAGVQAFAVYPGAVHTVHIERHHEAQLGKTWTSIHSSTGDRLPHSSSSIAAKTC